MSLTRSRFATAMPHFVDFVLSVPIRGRNGAQGTMLAAYIWGLVLCSVLMAGCFASQAGQLADDPDAPWIPGLPVANSFAGIVELDSDPSGAEVTTSLGSGCRTPCSLEVSAEGPFTVTFTHEGHESTTVEVKIQHARMGVSERKFV